MKHTVDFDQLDWLEWAEVGTARSKTAIFPGLRLRLVELSHQFAKTDWCENDHAGYVIEGTVEVEIEGQGSFRCEQGHGLVIPRGLRHRSKNVGSGAARLFLVEQLENRKVERKAMAAEADMPGDANS